MREVILARLIESGLPLAAACGPCCKPPARMIFYPKTPNFLESEAQAIACSKRKTLSAASRVARKKGGTAQFVFRFS